MWQRLTWNSAALSLKLLHGPAPCVLHLGSRIFALSIFGCAVVAFHLWFTAVMLFRAGSRSTNLPGLSYKECISMIPFLCEAETEQLQIWAQPGQLTPISKHKKGKGYSSVQRPWIQSLVLQYNKDMFIHSHTLTAQSFAQASLTQLFSNASLILRPLSFTEAKDLSQVSHSHYRIPVSKKGNSEKLWYFPKTQPPLITFPDFRGGVSHEQAPVVKKWCYKFLEPVTIEENCLNFNPTEAHPRAGDRVGIFGIEYKGGYQNKIVL